MRRGRRARRGSSDPRAGGRGRHRGATMSRDRWHESRMAERFLERQALLEMRSCRRGSEVRVGSASTRCVSANSGTLSCCTSARTAVASSTNRSRAVVVGRCSPCVRWALSRLNATVAASTVEPSSLRSARCCSRASVASSSRPRKKLALARLRRMARRRPIGPDGNAKRYPRWSVRYARPTSPPV